MVDADSGEDGREPSPDEGVPMPTEEQLPQASLGGMMPSEEQLPTGSPVNK